MTQRLEIVVSDIERKTRLDEYLFSKFGTLSKMYLREVVKDERCEVNGRAENVGYRLRKNDFIEIEVDLKRETSMRPENIPLEIIFEDEWLIMVSKPAGMLVHPSNYERNGTLLNALSFYLNDGKNVVTRPGLIHRLDKETSGLIVIAKDHKMHQKMTALFERRYVHKRYLALVKGVVADDEGEINAPIGRFGDEKRWGVKDGAKPSKTRFWVLERSADATLLKLEPFTGRTNQLRIHCQHIGHPIIGDVQRGGGAADRMMLHSFSISFRHPFTKEELFVSTPIPARFHVR